MNTSDGSSSKKIVLIRTVSLMMLALGIMLLGYGYHYYRTYQSIKVVVNKTATVEYGSANYDINNLIKEVEGEIVSVKKDIDTSVVGEQEIIVEVKKENIVREIPIVVSVVDTVAPVITLKEESIEITEGEEYNFLDNIESVTDEVDGTIEFLEEVLEDSVNYYNLSYEENVFDVGTHEIKITAKDKYGNEAEATYNFVVKEKPQVQPQQRVYSNLPANPAGGDISSIAYSLVGMPYASGANGPYAFDCSGFVQYVYSQVGINVSRSSSTQLYDGYAVSYEEAQPGDILSWGYVDGVATHSALYVGNGQMVHAANPSQGVIASDVAAWTRGSGSRVISVRRIQ